jgi:hypothetical protein
LSLLSPACELLPQAAVPEAGQASGQDQAVPADSWQAIFQEIMPAGQVQALLSDALLDLSSSALLGRLLQNRLDYWLDEFSAGQSGWLGRITRRSLYLDWRLDRQQLWIYLSFELKTPFGGVQRQTAAVVPLWIGSGGERSEKAEADQVWLLDNFSRGQQLRRCLGGNLPADFPVIARFLSGEALSIKSMDLTAPSYQEASVVLDRIGRQINDLAAFQGAVHHRAQQTVAIAPAEITSRRLLLVIPDNCRQVWLESVLDEAARQAAAAGVSLEVMRQGSSARYAGPED